MLHGWQRRWGALALCIMGSMSEGKFATAAGAGNQNFFVLAPNTRLADKVVGQAEILSSRIRAAWLEGPLPTTRTPTSVYVEIDPERSFARTLIDPDAKRNLIWLVGSEEAVTGHLLQHEIVHLELVGKYGEKFPIWGNEGIASQYDNARRHEVRDEQLSDFVETNNWPQLRTLFKSRIRQPWQYAASISVSDYLIARGGRKCFVRFLSESSDDPDHALQKNYGIASIDELQADWQSDVRRSMETSIPIKLAKVPSSSSRSAQ